MKDSSMRSVLIGCLVFLPAVFGLTACGGGGGGSASNLPDFPVDRDSARTLIGGSPLNLNSEQITAELEETFRTSDTILVSDLHVFFDTGERERIEASCSGDTCTFTHPATIDTATVSISDLGGSGGYQETAVEQQTIAIRNGVSLFQVRSSAVDTEGDELEYVGYGGWLDHSAFSLDAAAFLGDDANFATVYGISIGDAPGTNPTGSGTATWTGVMVGADVSATSTRGNVIHGDAGITVDFGDTNVDVSFTSVVDLDTGQSRRDMDWANLPMTQGTFDSGSGGDQIEGRFYGPNHEEVGGVFERDQIVGAFGAKRN